MGVKNGLELKVPFIKGRNHRVCHRRIHDCRLLTARDHKHIIVVEHWDQAYLQGF